MSVTLNLGGVVFQDFEIPESINFGGEQKLIVHKLPGGSRVIDAMGPDDSDIRWSGKFRGSNAEQRAILLDFMRRQGKQVLLAWGVHRYQAVISKFDAEFQYGGIEIAYSISCTIVIDESQALASIAVGFAESMVGDLITATGLGTQIGIPAINTAVTSVGTALSNYQAGVPSSTNLITGAAAATEGQLLTGLMTSISGAQTATSAAIASTGTAINTTGSVAGATAGAAPAAIASGLTAQASAFGTLNNLYQLSSTLGRMSINTNNAGN